MARQQKSQKRRQRLQKRRQRSQKQQQGGAGAADWALKVYGPAGQQHAVAGTNVIATNAVMRGGRQPGDEPKPLTKSEIVELGNASTGSDVAANQNDSAASTGSDVAVTVTEEPVAEELVAEEPVAEEPVPEEPVAEVAATDASGNVVTGGKVDLTSIAVPAVLIAANQLYVRRRGRKTAKKSRRGRRSNRRYSRRR